MYVTSQRDGRPRRRVLAVIAAVLTLGLLASGCGAGSGAATESSEDKTITIGWIPWDEDIAATHLWKHILEDQGYTVELKQLDAAPLYAGMAEEDIDLFLDGWLPITHEDYWAEYKSDLEDIGVWYDHAKLTIAVNKDAPVDSLEDLNGKAGDFGDRIVGIEPSAGLTRVTKDDVMPAYGMDNLKLVTGSTPAMLAELQRATKSGENIVVTLWRPHWAYTAFPIKDLEDPKGKLGEAEQIHMIAREGFSEDHPEVVKMLKRFKMDDAQLGDLENYVFNKFEEGQEAKAVAAWMKENQDYVKSLTRS